MIKMETKDLDELKDKLNEENKEKAFDIEVRDGIIRMSIMKDIPKSQFKQLASKASNYHRTRQHFEFTIYTKESIDKMDLGDSWELYSKNENNIISKEEFKKVEYFIAMPSNIFDIIKKSNK